MLRARSPVELAWSAWAMRVASRSALPLPAARPGVPRLLGGGRWHQPPEHGVVRPVSLLPRLLPAGSRELSVRLLTRRNAPELATAFGIPLLPPGHHSFRHQGIGGPPDQGRGFIAGDALGMTRRR